MNTKTPAMILQEFTVKNHLRPPEYNVVMSKTGSHENEFHYDVAVANLIARGFGRSKQVAKHAAAANALEMLTEVGLFDANSTPVHNFNAQAHRNESDNPDTPSINHIGVLKDFCCENKIPQPEFKELSDVGPPHNREFTYECIVDSLTTQANAKTKKQAKQLAAKEMLEKIKIICPHSLEQVIPDTKSITEKDNEAVERFQQATLGVMPNRGAKVPNFPLALTYLIKEKLKTVEDFEKLLATPTWDSLDEICAILEIQYKFDVIQEDPTIVTVVFGIDTPLAMMALGTDVEEAREKIIIDIFMALNVFMTLSDDNPFFV